AAGTSGSCSDCAWAASSSTACRWSTTPSRCIAPSTRPTAKTSSRSQPSSGSIGRRHASASSSASTRRSANSRPRRKRRRPSTPRSPASTRTRSRTAAARSTTYVQALEAEPADATALAALDVLYGRLGRWEPYVDVLRRRIELDVTEVELVDLKFRLGSTLERHLGEPAGALENYREILFVEPTHQGARGALEAMLEGDLRSEAASILESIYEERGDWPRLIRALEILSGAEGDLEKR